MIGRVSARMLSFTALCVGVAAVAGAQSRRPGEHDAVVLALSVDSAAEDNGRQGEADVRAPQFQGLRLTSGFQASLTYNELQRDHVGWQLTGTTGGVHYANLHAYVPSGQTVGAVLTLALGQRTRVNINEGVAYLPNYALASLLTPAAGSFGAEVQPTADHAIVKTPSYSMASTVTVNQDVTRRVTLMLTYGAQRREFIDGDEPDMSSSNVAGRFIYRLTKSAALHAGYGRRLGSYSRETGVQRANIDDIDLGIDYNRALSLPGSRRTTVSFSTGSAITGDQLHRGYSLTGAARLDHAVGRTGYLGLAYERRVRLMDGFVAPVFADTITASAGSRLAPRVGVGTTIGYALGAVGGGTEGNGLRSVNGSARLTVAVTRGAGLYAEYGYYQHQISEGVELLAHMPTAQRRQTLHVGVNVQVRLIRQQVRERK